MKLQNALTLSLALILCPFLRASDLPAPMPEFMNDAQAAKWCADMEAKGKAETAEAPTQFYTGKPYDAEAGGYIFKYRTYNPEMARWTTADPSGFPDGVNNQIYAPHVTSQLDNDGLQVWELEMTTTGNLDSTDPGHVYGWHDHVAVGSSDELRAYGSVDVSIAPNTPSTGATMSGVAIAISLPTNPFSQTGSGTENLGDGQYRNYVSVTASFLLTKVSDGVTTVSTIQSGIGTLYGPAFE